MKEMDFLNHCLFNHMLNESFYFYAYTFKAEATSFTPI